MEDRSVLQWDKDDCAAVGLVKFDLLGLGMLSALHYAVDLIARAPRRQVDLATIPQEDAVYDMLCEADSVGVFQVESRAQMATLPRLQAPHLLRPRGRGRPHPARAHPGRVGAPLHPPPQRPGAGHLPAPAARELRWRKTLGVPLFQEQLMQMAIDVAGFTPAEADQLRQAMGSKRSRERMERLRQRLYDGMAERGITGDDGRRDLRQAGRLRQLRLPREPLGVLRLPRLRRRRGSSCYYPAAFCAALLNAQPMGFYSPHSLVQDARRHGVVVRTPDVNASGRRRHARAVRRELTKAGWPVRLGHRRRCGASATTWPSAIAAGRPYADLEDLVRRAPALPLAQLEALATAGAFGCFDRLDGAAGERRCGRRGRWPRAGPTGSPGVVTGADAPPLPGMSEPEEAVADLWATGVAPDGHPTQFVRDQLDEPRAWCRRRA